MKSELSKFITIKSHLPGTQKLEPAQEIAICAFEGNQKKCLTAICCILWTLLLCVLLCCCVVSMLGTVHIIPMLSSNAISNSRRGGIGSKMNTSVYFEPVQHTQTTCAVFQSLFSLSNSLTKQKDWRPNKAVGYFQTRRNSSKRALKTCHIMKLAQRLRGGA